MYYIFYKNYFRSVGRNNIYEITLLALLIKWPDGLFIIVYCVNKSGVFWVSVIVPEFESGLSSKHGKNIPDELTYDIFHHSTL